MSGQYMMHGAIRSLLMLRTRPPALSECPEGVSSGYDGAGGFIGPMDSGDCGVGPREGELLRENGRPCPWRDDGDSGETGEMKRGEMLCIVPCGMVMEGPWIELCGPWPWVENGRGLPQPMQAMLRLNIAGGREYSRGNYTAKRDKRRVVKMSKSQSSRADDKEQKREEVKGSTEGMDGEERVLSEGRKIDF